MDRTPSVTAIGVVKDFHYTGLQHAIEPFAISLRGGYDYLTLKIDTQNINESLSFIEEKYKELFPNSIFEYTFLDEDFNRLYQREEQTATIFSIFTFLGIFIACLGLFGLAIVFIAMFILMPYTIALFSRLFEVIAYQSASWRTGVPYMNYKTKCPFLKRKLLSFSCKAEQLAPFEVAAFEKCHKKI